jgi:hypothetical protein
MGEQKRLFAEPLTVAVRTGRGSISYREVGPQFTDVVDEVDRVPRNHSGWQSVKYGRRRFQLFGGIRTPHFICLNSPLGPGRD